MRKAALYLSVLLTAIVILTGCAHTNTSAVAWERPVIAESSYVVPDRLENLPTQWDITALYPDHEAFFADMARAEELIKAFDKYRGRIATVDGMIEYLNDTEIREYYTIMDRASLYKNLIQSLDSTDPWALEVNARRQTVKDLKSDATDFIDEEIYALSQKKRQKLFGDERLKDFAFYYADYLEPEPETLSDREQLLSDMFYELAWETYDIFNVFAYAEMPWPTFTYPDGTEGQLSDDVVISILGDPKYSQEFRNEIILMRCGVYEQFANTFAGLLENYIKSNCCQAQIEGYDNYLELALEDTGVTLDLYNNIIEFGRSIAPEMERYHEIKRQQLGFEKLEIADIYIASSSYSPKQVSYEDAVNSGREAVKVLGNDYMEKFDRVFTGSHVDVYPTDTKEGGAFSSSQGLVTFPYVLLNFDGTEAYISTIVHELGHSCYDQYTNESQHYLNQDPTLFTHEVASTVNEFLFFNYMLDNAQTKDEKLFWLESLIIDIYNGSIVRQCIYSEFEDWCYKTLEAGDYLTADDMQAKFVGLFREYYPSLEIPYEYGTDWVRLDHFYYDYYVYKYATAAVYAAAIVDRIQTLGQPAIDDYKDFLRAGDSRPIDELLKLAGVDPYDQATYDFAKDQLKGLVDQYEALVTN